MTIDDGMYTAVVDRFENDHAVLLVEDDGTTIGEVVVDQDRLPEAGQVDAVLTIEIQDGEITESRYDRAVTKRRANRTQARFDRLSDRLSSPEEDDTDH